MSKPRKPLPGGKLPAVVLQNPKYAHNVGAVLRACSCYRIPQLIYTGIRVPMPGSGAYGKGHRLPREERMKGYRDVELANTDFPFDRLMAPDIHVVGIEIAPGASPLTWHEHKPKQVYVFGPEDGGLSKTFKSFCHELLYIPSRHCLNLAASVYTVLYDRQFKANYNGMDPMGGPGAPLSPADVENEDRGLITDFGETSTQ